MNQPSPLDILIALNILIANGVLWVWIIRKLWRAK